MRGSKSKYRFIFFIGLAAVLLLSLAGCESRQADKTDQAKAAESATNIAKGRELYLSYGCASCHGVNGDGKGISAKGFYPPPTNFHNPKLYQKGTDAQSISSAIKYGIKEESSVMPAFDHITQQELDQLVSYLQSLQKKEE